MLDAKSLGRARSARAKRDNDKEGIRSTKYNSSSNNNMPDGAAQWLQKTKTSRK